MDYINKQKLKRKVWRLVEDMGLSASSLHFIDVTKFDTKRRLIKMLDQVIQVLQTKEEIIWDVEPDNVYMTENNSTVNSK